MSKNADEALRIAWRTCPGTSRAFRESRLEIEPGDDGLWPHVQVLRLNRLWETGDGGQVLQHSRKMRSPFRFLPGPGQWICRRALSPVLLDFGNHRYSRVSGWLTNQSPALMRTLSGALSCNGPLIVSLLRPSIVLKNSHTLPIIGLKSEIYTELHHYTSRG